MALIEIDPNSFREFVENYAESDETRTKVENMTDEAIIELVENNINDDDLMEVINDAETTALSSLEF